MTKLRLYWFLAWSVLVLIGVIRHMETRQSIGVVLLVLVTILLRRGLAGGMYRRLGQPVHRLCTVAGWLICAAVWLVFLLVCSMPWGHPFRALTAVVAVGVTGQVLLGWREQCLLRKHRSGE